MVVVGSRPTDGGAGVPEESHGSPWIGESEAGVARRALGESGRQDGNFDVVVVVHLGGPLAGVRSGGAAGVLDEASLERDRACQEQRVECGTVEAFADEVARRDHQ